jgi:hypothetical protein
VTKTKTKDNRSEKEIQFENLLKQRDQISGELRDLENRKADLLLEQSNLERRMKDLLVGKVSRAEEAAPKTKAAPKLNPAILRGPLRFGNGEEVDLSGLNLTPATQDVLRCVQNSTHRPLTIAYLAEKTKLSLSGVAGALKLLQSHGIVSYKTEKHKNGAGREVDTKVWTPVTAPTTVTSHLNGAASHG